MADTSEENTDQREVREALNVSTLRQQANLVKDTEGNSTAGRVTGWPYSPSPTMAAPRPTISCDQEAWVIARLTEFSELLRHIYLERMSLPLAAHTMMEGAIEGAIHGVANELVDTLGLQAPWINLRPRVPRR